MKRFLSTRLKRKTAGALTLTLKKPLLDALAVTWGDELELTLFDNLLVLRPRGAALSGERVAEAIEMFGAQGETPWAGPRTREVVKAVQTLGTPTLKEIVEHLGSDYEQTVALLAVARRLGLLVSPKRGVWRVAEDAKDVL